MTADRCPTCAECGHIEAYHLALGCVACAARGRCWHFKPAKPACPTCGSEPPFEGFDEVTQSRCADDFHGPKGDEGRKCDLCERRCPPDDEWSCPSCDAWVCGQHPNAGDHPHTPAPPADVALEEARKNYTKVARPNLNEFGDSVVTVLIRAERADAERAQRERADGLERDHAELTRRIADGMADHVEEAVKEATRPYRMAIARWYIAFREGTPTDVRAARLAVEGTITAADIEEARKEADRGK